MCVLSRLQSNCHADCFYINILILKSDFSYLQGKRKERGICCRGKKQSQSGYLRMVFAFKITVQLLNLTNHVSKLLCNMCLNISSHIALCSCKVLFIQNGKQGSISMSIACKWEKWEDLCDLL